MPNKTITKNLLIVIFSACVSALSSCGHGPVSGGKPPAFDGESSAYTEPRIDALIESEDIVESSGIAASKCQQGVLWTHNDSGDDAYLFATDTKGKSLGTWKVQNAANKDWEDIAAFKDETGKCFLFIGDIGNRRKEPRPDHDIYRVAEPEIVAGDAGTTKKNPSRTEPADVITFSYPDGRQDAETLMVHPVTGEIYIVTKQRNKAAGVYRIKPAFGSPPVKAEKVIDVTVPAIPNGFLTGGDIAPDGKRLVLCDYFAAYEFVLPDNSADFNDVWKQKPSVINLGNRDQGEAIGYSADGTSIYATSEGQYSPLIEVRALRTGRFPPK
ncbi:MAG: hypothetical protein HOP17_14135 [Acidobacteria bacterium]|nr:hypothetical protein [Acidobacteriota bacterium]